LVALAAGWLLGVTTQQPAVKAVTVEVPSPPIVQEKVRIEKVEVTTPVFIDRIRYIERDIGTAVTIYDPVYTSLEDWQSVEELRAFLDADDTESNVTIISQTGGQISFTGQCEDFALQLRARAAAIGKNLEIIAINSAELNKWKSYFGNKSLSNGDYHALNMAIIGNEIWYVEPQQDICWHAMYLD
jgi:hypothetical protein